MLQWADEEIRYEYPFLTRVAENVIEAGTVYAVCPECCWHLDASTVERHLIWRRTAFELDAERGHVVALVGDWGDNEYEESWLQCNQMSCYARLSLPAGIEVHHY